MNEGDPFRGTIALRNLKLVTALALLAQVAALTAVFWRRGER